VTRRAERLQVRLVIAAAVGTSDDVIDVRRSLPTPTALPSVTTQHAQSHPLRDLRVLPIGTAGEAATIPRMTRALLTARQ
jgi:hypothetical protein